MWFAWMSLALLCVLASAAADYTVTVDTSKVINTWEGWGCSLAWWANVFGDRSDIADLIFSTKLVAINGTTLPGLGMNMARYNAGGCSWNAVAGEKMVPSPNIPHFKQIEAFWLDPSSRDPASSSFNWSKDAKQQQMVTMATARGVNILQLFSNSPTWWMCKNHNPSGSQDGISDNLQSSQYDGHAAYLAAVAAHFEGKGIHFNTVELFNEPSSGWWKADGTQEGCHFSASTQAQVLPYLRRELDSRGLQHVQIAASDETAYDLALSTWMSFSGDVKALVDEVTTHGYQYGGGRRDLLYDAVSKDKKRLYNSEYGEGDATGQSLASNLNLDFRWLHMTAWCYWQPFDIYGWGLLEADLPGAKVGAAAPKYFVLAQYTRHVRPGYTILDNSNDGNTVMAYSAGEKKLVLVTATSSTQHITYDLRGCTLASPAVTRWTTAMHDGGDKYVMRQDVVISGSQFTVAFDANTIQTFEITGVQAIALHVEHGHHGHHGH